MITLTNQERKVLNYYQNTAARDKDIAVALGISLKTAQYYMRSLRKKLKIDNRNRLLIKEENLYV